MPGVPGLAAGAGTGLGSRRLFCKRWMDGCGQANGFSPSSPAGEEEECSGMLQQPIHRCSGSVAAGCSTTAAMGCSSSVAVGCSSRTVSKWKT